MNRHVSATQHQHIFFKCWTFKHEAKIGKILVTFFNFYKVIYIVNSTTLQDHCLVAVAASPKMATQLQLQITIPKLLAYSCFVPISYTVRGKKTGGWFTVCTSFMII